MIEGIDPPFLTKTVEEHVSNIQNEGDEEKENY